MSEDWGFRLNWARMGDDRKELLKRFTGGREPTAADARVFTCFVKALAETVASRRRTAVRGLGVFTWRPFRAHMPDGSTKLTQRLWFHSECIVMSKRGRRRTCS